MDFSNLWHVIWVLFSIFVFVSYLMALFAVIGDLFRDHQLNGWLKALWLLLLFFVPILTLLVYLIVRGSGMAARSAAAQKEAEDATRAYIQEAAGTGPAAEIAAAQKLLKDGAITEAEFTKLKAKALS